MKRIVVKKPEDIDKILATHRFMTLLGVHCAIDGDKEKWVVCLQG